jgi:hypothetical protein
MKRLVLNHALSTWPCQLLLLLRTSRYEGPGLGRLIASWLARFLSSCIKLSNSGALEQHCRGASSAHIQLLGTGNKPSVFAEAKLGVPVLGT